MTTQLEIVILSDHSCSQSAQVDFPIVRDICGNRGYWYMAPVVTLKEIAGRVLCKVDYSEHAPDNCLAINGTLLLLEKSELKNRREHPWRRKA